MRMEAVLVAVGHLEGADVAVDLRGVVPIVEGLELMFDRVLALGEALEGGGLFVQEHLEIIADPMGNRQGDEVHPHVESLCSFQSIFEFLAATFGDLGGANRTRPDATTDQEALVERLVVDALGDLDVTQGLTGHGGTKDHALACPGVRQELVDDSLEGPPDGPGQLGVLFGDFTGFGVKTTGL